MKDFTMSMYATKEELVAARAKYRNEMETEIRQRITNGEKGDDIPIIMEDVFGCDYEAACEAVFSGNQAKALALLNQAIPVANHG